MTRLLTLRRAVVAAATTPLLLTGLAACGNDGAAGPAATATDTAATSAGPAAGLAAGDKVQPADFARQVTEGFTRVTTAHATMTGSMGAAGDMSAQGDVDYTGATPATSMTVKAGVFGSEGAQVRLVDKVMYLNLGQLSQHKYWKLDLNAPNSPFGALGSQLDPKSSTKLLEKGMTSVTYVGDEGGLHHYAATVDPKAMLAAMGQAAAGAQAALPQSMDYDLWLDDQSRMTRATFTMGKLGSMEMTLSDFGADVSVEAPPAGQVTDMPGMPGMGASPRV